MSLLQELATRFYRRIDPVIGEAQENLTKRMPEADQAEQVGALRAYRQSVELFNEALTSLEHDPDDDPEEAPTNPLLEDDDG